MDVCSSSFNFSAAFGFEDALLAPWRPTEDGVLLPVHYEFQGVAAALDALRIVTTIDVDGNPCDVIAQEVTVREQALEFLDYPGSRPKLEFFPFYITSESFRRNSESWPLEREGEYQPNVLTMRARSNLGSTAHCLLGI